ncbi:hypothetical protein [Winogradskyella sp. R77965]|uniref:hypothetical protein n=1 Tax=Winogradskyella sp. R77965 TaxID=3093872 RepID=UPI0037DDCDF3
MSEEAEEQIKKQKKRINWTTDKIMSTSALFISVISLIALLYQSYLAREENKLIQMQQSASVLPHLSQWSSYKSDSFKIVIGNKGVGPAFIKKVEVKMIDNKKDTLVFNSSDDILKSIFKNTKGLDSIGYTSSTLTDGIVLPANEKLEIINIKNPAGINLFRKVLSESNLSFNIIYADVYGTQWIINANKEIPVKIDTK